VAVLLDQAGIALLAVVGFVLGTGQTLVDTGAQSILPALVSREANQLERANGRLVGTQVVTQELAGPPAGGFLFSLATWIPFAVDAVSFAAGSALVASIRGHGGGRQPPGLGRRRRDGAVRPGAARSFGLRAPFLVAEVVIPVVALLCLPAINTRTIAEARAAAGLEPCP
jgi:hypothetical protein